MDLLGVSRAGSDFLFDGPSLHLEGYAFTVRFLPSWIFEQIFWYLFLLLIFRINSRCYKWILKFFIDVLRTNTSQIFFGLKIMLLKVTYNYLQYFNKTVIFVNILPSIFTMPYKFTKKCLISLQILPIIVYVSSLICLLYFLGIMQVIIRFLALIMQFSLGTTSGESIAAAANIFIGMAEAPMVIRPLLGRMTNSELHAIMASGFATISGGVMGAFVAFGVSDYLM